MSRVKIDDHSAKHIQIVGIENETVQSISDNVPEKFI